MNNIWIAGTIWLIVGVLCTVSIYIGIYRWNVRTGKADKAVKRAIIWASLTAIVHGFAMIPAPCFEVARWGALIPLFVVYGMTMFGIYSPNKPT